MDFLYYLIKVAVIALQLDQVVKDFAQSQQNSLVTQPSIANGISSNAIGSQYTSGLIFLHGLATEDNLIEMARNLTGKTLGLDESKTMIRIPKAPRRDISMIPEPFKRLLVGDWKPRSWFDFWKLPAVSVLTKSPSESEEELKVAMKWVEDIIQDMIREGIPPENIVLSGASQGGALTLYTILHTKYKIGGFIPMVTWAPLLKSQPPTSLSVPVNKDTPIFHMNGQQDLILVPPICGKKNF